MKLFIALILGAIILIFGAIILIFGAMFILMLLAYAVTKGDSANEMQIVSKWMESE